MLDILLIIFHIISIFQSIDAYCVVFKIICRFLQEAKQNDPDGEIAKAKAARKAESYLAEERKLHEAYQVLLSHHYVRRAEREKQKKQNAMNASQNTVEMTDEEIAKAEADYRWLGNMDVK